MRSLLCTGAAALALAVSASAGPITICGDDGATRAACATFAVVGGNLEITLDNTSTFDVLNPPEVLTGLFFEIDGLPTLSPVSAIIAAGSTVDHAPFPAGGNVGGEWAYRGDLAGNPYGADYGISSAGFGIFGNANFNGPDLDPPTSVNGLNYGITSAGDNPNTGNTPIVTRPYIRHAVVFKLSGIPQGFDPMAKISNITFQYGTALDEGHFPEPSTFGMLLLAGLLIRRR